MPQAKTRRTRATGGRSRRTRQRPGRSRLVHSTARTGARRAAQLRQTLSGRSKEMAVEFEDLGPEEAPWEEDAGETLPPPKSPPVP